MEKIQICPPNSVIFSHGLRSMTSSSYSLYPFLQNGGISAFSSFGIIVHVATLRNLHFIIGTLFIAHTRRWTSHFYPGREFTCTVENTTKCRMETTVCKGAAFAGPENVGPNHQILSAKWKTKLCACICAFFGRAIWSIIIQVLHLSKRRLLQEHFLAHSSVKVCSRLKRCLKILSHLKCFVTLYTL